MGCYSGKSSSILVGEVSSKKAEAKSRGAGSPASSHDAIRHGSGAAANEEDEAADSHSVPVERRRFGTRNLRRGRKRKTLDEMYLGLTFNGFPVKPEPVFFTCREEFQAPWSVPIEAFFYKPDASLASTVYSNGDVERRIHCHIELTPKELHCLEAMREQVARQKLRFYPTIAAGASRALSRARGDKTKAIDFLVGMQAWRDRFFKTPLSDATVLEDMKHGIAYFTGRDPVLRPILVLRFHRIPSNWFKNRETSRVINLLVFCLEYFSRFMVVPGRIESLNVVADLKGLGVTQMPLGPIQDLYHVMNDNYTGRVCKIHVCNMSVVLSGILNVVKNTLLTERQRQKLSFYDNAKEVAKDFAPSQLEVDFGGTRPVIKAPLPFPLLPGPFDVGYDGKPDFSAPTGSHSVLTHAGTLGRLWNPHLTPEQNGALEFNSKAVEFFKTHNRPLPGNPSDCRDLSLTASIVDFSRRRLEAFSGGVQDVSTTATTFSGPAFAPKEPFPVYSEGLTNVATNEVAREFVADAGREVGLNSGASLDTELFRTVVCM